MNKNVKYLIESVYNFDVTQYQDEEDDIIDNQTIMSVNLYKYSPDNKEELINIITQKFLDVFKKNQDKELITIDLSDINTKNITDMSYLFTTVFHNEYIYPHLKKFKIILDLTSWNTSNVTDMQRMFYMGTSLVEINLQNFDTTNVETMYGMFEYCELLQELDLSNFNTSKVKNMAWMFEKCKQLKTLDLSNFDTSKVRKMEEMFHECYSLETLNLL